MLLAAAAVLAGVVYVLTRPKMPEPESNGEEINLSGINSILPPEWNLESGSDSLVDILKAGTGISASIYVEKCEESAEEMGAAGGIESSCFGSGRSNFTEVPGGGIWDLTSDNSFIDFGFVATKDGNNKYYLASFDFGNHLYSKEEYDEARNIMFSVFQHIFIDKDKTADYKLYRNGKCGFELAYPADWSVEEREADVLKCQSDVEFGANGLLDPESARFLVNVSDTNDFGAESLEVWAEEIKEQGEDVKPITFGKDNYKGIIIDYADTSEDGTLPTVYVQKGGAIYELQGNVPTDAGKGTKNRQVFDKILSSFRFIER